MPALDAPKANDHLRWLRVANDGKTRPFPLVTDSIRRIRASFLHNNPIRLLALFHQRRIDACQFFWMYIQFFLKN
jgi:hypothetical protein